MAASISRQRGQSADLFLALLIKLGAVERIAGNFRQNGQAINSSFDLMTALLGDHQDPHWTGGGLDRDIKCRESAGYAFAVEFK